MAEKKQTSAGRLHYWQGRYEQAKIAFASQRAAMTRRAQYYLGGHEVLDTAGVPTRRGTGNVRNIVYELVESQVDSSVPAPRVTALHPEDKALAANLEAFLRYEAARLDLRSLNDLHERMTPVQGAAWALVEWDSRAGTHCAAGDVRVTPLHPRQVTPQPGVAELADMDYIFVTTAQTRAAVQARFGVDVSAAGETEPEVRDPAGDPARGDGTAGPAPADELVTQVDCYYRSDAAPGAIGRISWADGVLLADEPDYQGRRLEVCAVCGRPRARGEKKCPDCGGKRFLHRAMPCHRPGCFPLVLRRNISRYGCLLGMSDVDVIADQQEAIKKFGAKIDEKILKGGSYVTLPAGRGVETSDRELKIIRVRDAAEKALIGVVNVQPDIARDQTQLEQNYTWAKSALGITDAYQGKYDASAQSGTAKQFSASQSAGRLQSKRSMKAVFYSRLYELIFRWLLAYADGPIPYAARGTDGQETWAHFDPAAFVRRDAAGQLYWNDEFLFSVDESASLASNRETLWNMADLKFQAGAFGPVGELASAEILWTWLEATGYPGAGSVHRAILARMQAEGLHAGTAGGAGLAAGQNAAGGALARAALPDGDL